MHTLQHIKIDDVTYHVYGNKRTEPDVFKNDVKCDFCDNYVPKVVNIPNVKCDNILICNSCLHKFSKAINAATMEDCLNGTQE